MKASQSTYNYNAVSSSVVIAGEQRVSKSWTKPIPGDFAVVVGNGLTLDLLGFLDPYGEHLRSTWHSQWPLGWEVPTPGKPDQRLLSNLPTLEAYIVEHRKANPDSSDFQIFEDIFSLPRFDNKGHGITVNMLRQVEGRHFLALAYSAFQQKTNHHVRVNPRNVFDWHWFEYFRRLRSRIGILISFNYDLILEILLNTLAVPVGRYGLQDETGIPMFKPHGSIDYEVYAAFGTNTAYPPTLVAEDLNAPIYRLKKAELLKPRTHPGLVAPNEYSRQLNFQWVAPAYRYYQNNAHRIKHFWLIGIAYGPYDRTELNFLIDSLEPDTAIYIANPYPCNELLERLYARGFFKVSVIGPHSTVVDDLVSKFPQIDIQTRYS